MIHKMENGTLTLCPTGELDHHSVVSVRSESDELLKRYNPKKAVIDFDGVTFCDSSGIAYVMGRYRLIRSSGGSLALTNVPAKILVIFTMAGMDKMIEMDKKEDKR